MRRDPEDVGQERTDPVPSGRAPAPAEAAVTDWSRDGVTALLGTLVEALGAADR